MSIGFKQRPDGKWESFPIIKKNAEDKKETPNKETVKKVEAIKKPVNPAKRVRREPIKKAGG